MIGTNSQFSIFVVRSNRINVNLCASVLSHRRELSRVTFLLLSWQFLFSTRLSPYSPSNIQIRPLDFRVIRNIHSALTHKIYTFRFLRRNLYRKFFMHTSSTDTPREVFQTNLSTSSSRRAFEKSTSSIRLVVSHDGRLYAIRFSEMRTLVAI